MAVMQENSLSKTLLPLILLLMLVILLTVIVSNLKPDPPKEMIAGMEPVPELLPFTGSYGRTKENPEQDVPSREETVVRNAIIKWRTGKIEEAENDFRTILVFDPKNLSALSCLGTIFFSQRKYREAELLFRRKTEAYPSNFIGFRNLALALFRQDKVKDAVKEMKRASALNPDDMETLLLLARLYAYSGDNMNAAVCLKRAKDNNADLSDILQENIFLSLKMDKEAWSCLEDREKK